MTHVSVDTLEDLTAVTQVIAYAVWFTWGGDKGGGYGGGWGGGADNRIGKKLDMDMGEEMDTN